MSVRICQNCRAQVPDGASFCPGCGKEVVPAPLSSPEASQVTKLPSHEEVVLAPSSPLKQPQRSKPPWRKEVTVGALVLGILLIVVLISYFNPFGWYFNPLINLFNSGTLNQASEHNDQGVTLPNQGNQEGVSQIGTGLIDLGVPDGYVVAAAYAVNDSGQVVGECWLPDATTRAFLWTGRDGFKILLPPGWTNSRALDINNLGQVVGHGRVGSAFRAFVWDETHGCIDLGLPAGYDTCVARAINDQGQIVGSAGGRAFIWNRESGFTILGVPEGCVNSSAFGINNQGQVAGHGYTGMAECDRAFVWDRQSGFTNLGIPPGLDESLAHIQVADINDNGQVVGSGRGQAVGSTMGKTFSYLWSQTDGFVDLGIPPGCYYFERATAVNNQGQVTGHGLAGAGRTVAVVWDKRGGWTVIEFPANWTKASAYDINNSGTVVGWGSVEGVGRRAYLFRTP